MELDDRGLGFKEDDVGLPRFKGRPKALRGELASDTVQPKHLVTAGLQEGCRACRNDRVDGRWVAKPLELTVLREQRRTLWRGDRWIAKRNPAWFEF